MSPREVARPFVKAGLSYQPGDTYMAGLGLEDSWLEATLRITLPDGTLDRTHDVCLTNDDGMRMLHARACQRPDEFTNELA